jgi:hypothetical protein
MWSSGGADTIIVYNDPSSICGVAIAEGAKEFSDLHDVSQYRFNSRTRRPRTGEFVVLQNTHGFYAVLRIKSIEAKSHGGKKHELRLFYVIGEDGKSDFSKYEIFE